MTAPVQFARYQRNARPDENTSDAALIAWMYAELGRIQVTNPGVFVPPWTPGRTRSIADKLAERPSIFDWANPSGGGARDDAAQFRLSIDGAIREGIRALYVPGRGPWGNGQYRLDSQIELPYSLTLYSDSLPAGGTDDRVTGGATILHNFVGDQFVFNGTAVDDANTGGGIQGLRIVQVYGTGATPAGSAIRLEAGINWLKIRLNIIEECFTVHRPWTWAIDVDGSGTPCLDLFVGENSTHTSAAFGSGGAIRLNGCPGAALYQNYCYNTGAVVDVGDTDSSGSVWISGGNVSTLVLDNAANIAVVGGTYTDITNTVNTSGSLRPDRLVNAFVDNSGGSTGLDVFDVPTQTWIRTP